MMQTVIDGEDIDIKKVEYVHKIFMENIDINNIHLFAQYLYEKDKKLSQDLVFEIEANYMFNKELIDD